MCHLRYLVVSGSPGAMGEAQGETYRNEIQNFVARRVAHAGEFVRKYDPGRSLDRSEVLAAAEDLLDSHRNYDRALWDEFRGIARGAHVSEAELLVANGLTDIRDLVLFRGLDPRGDAKGTTGERNRRDSGECTSFGASAEACGGHPIIGQTWDMHPDARDFLLVVRREPADAPATLSLTTVGCMALTGVNSEGVGVCTSNLVPTDARDGICYLFTISKALSASSAHAAADIIESTQRLSGHAFMVADGAAVLDVETTARKARRTEHDSGVRVHSNHYLAPELGVLAFEGVDTSSSLWRRSHLDEAFRRSGRPVDESLCWELLSDATRGDGAVCNEDYDGQYGEVATAATVVIRPEEGAITACAGGARLGEQRRFTLSRT
ncbi:MAG: C45 family peptidase [Candidatus Eisenbacteria bacterium]